jgi:hypothetical protein
MAAELCIRKKVWGVVLGGRIASLPGGAVSRGAGRAHLDSISSHPYPPTSWEDCSSAPSRRRRRHELSGAYLLPIVHMHAHASSMSPGRQWMSRGDPVHVALRFCGKMLWRLSPSLGGSSSLRGFPWSVFAAIFSDMSSWLRVCFAGALQSCGSADGGPRERSERWSWRHMASIFACALRGLLWSVFAALFCVHELVASSLLRGRV